jgi:hypothetical protein
MGWTVGADQHGPGGDPGAQASRADASRRELDIGHAFLRRRAQQRR